LSTVKREKYSVFNFLSFPSQEDVEPDKQHQSEQALAPPVKGTGFVIIVIIMIITGKTVINIVMKLPE